MSASAGRILILAPKNVCDQWQIELRENFVRSRGLGLMTVRGTTRAGLVVTLVVSQLVIPQAFAKNGVMYLDLPKRKNPHPLVPHRA